MDRWLIFLAIGSSNFSPNRRTKKSVKMSDPIEVINVIFGAHLTDKTAAIRCKLLSRSIFVLKIDENRRISKTKSKFKNPRKLVRDNRISYMHAKFWLSTCLLAEVPSLERNFLIFP